MIISNVKKVRTIDRAAYAWAGLRKYQNLDMVTHRLTSIHGVPKKFKGDVRKQALQLRYCLVQAREYFAAAAAVSIATKPNLLYYGIMSLALAEILFKQSGNSSLDRARSENRHHGLTMSLAGTPRPASLAEASDLLRAYPMETGGVRRGTFELWHRGVREHPIPGNATQYLSQQGSTTSFQVLWGVEDLPYPPVPVTGLSLKECFQSLPFMCDHVESAGLRTNFVRGTCRVNLWPGPEWRTEHTFILHPDAKVQSLLHQLVVNANAVDRIDLVEVSTGIRLKLSSDWIQGRTGLRVPPAVSVNTDEWRMWSTCPPLNEFGYLYAALYLAGNYARYFPDKWLADVESSSPIAIAIEELCSIAEWRAPWLSLSELDQTLYVCET